MASIVLVHGMGNRGERAAATAALEQKWKPLLSKGLARAGWHDLPTDLTIGVAFYGDLYERTGAMGAAEGTQSSPEEAEIENALALHVIAAAASRPAADPRDSAQAATYLQAEQQEGPAMGPRALLRTPLQWSAQLRWLAVGGFAFAERFVNTAFNDVSTYLTDPELRSAARQRVLDLIDVDTRVVVGHSLGSVVAYEAAHLATQSMTLVTLGSPLGLRTIIFDRLEPQPPAIPAAVRRWFDFADEDDLVAAHTDLGPLFPPQSPGSAAVVSNMTLDNGSEPHDAAHYLEKAAVGAAIASAFLP